MDDNKENIPPPSTAVWIDVPTHTPDGTPLSGTVRHNTGRLPTPVDEDSEPVTPHAEANASEAFATPPDSGHRPAGAAALEENAEQRPFTIFEDARSPTLDGQDSQATTPIPAHILREIRRSSDGHALDAETTSSNEAGRSPAASPFYQVDGEALAEWDQLLGRSSQPGSTTIDAASTPSSVDGRPPSDAAAALESPLSRKRAADGLENHMPAKQARTWHDDVDFAAFGPEGSSVRLVAERIVAQSRVHAAFQKLTSAYNPQGQAVQANRSEDVRHSFGQGPRTLAIDEHSGRAYIDIPVPYKVDAALPVAESLASPRLQKVNYAGGDRARSSDNIEPSRFVQECESPSWLSERLEADRRAEQPSRADTPISTNGCDRSPARNRSRGR